jgi:flagellar biosynthetic protein FlhB
VPQSQELASVATLAVLILTLALLAPSLLQWFMARMGSAFDETEWVSVFASSKAFIEYTNAQIIDAMLAISPILVALAGASVLACLAVSGFNFAPQGLRLRWDSINPSSGLAKLVSTRSLVHLATSIAKLVFISIIVWLYLRDKLDTFATLRWAWSTELMAAIAKLIFGLCIRACIALLAIGIADAFYQKWKYVQELKMTRQEVRQEHKDLEGSPEVKARIRRIQIQMSMKRLLAEVPKANVILVNPTHVAVALRYEAKTMEAPVLLAKGADYLAEKIIAIGRAYGVPILRRPELARTIYSMVEPGAAIPAGLYVAVAEVLAMIYRLRQRKKYRT